MGTNCAPLVADLFLFCYERDFMKNNSRNNQADVIKAFNLMSRYLAYMSHRLICKLLGYSWSGVRPSSLSVVRHRPSPVVNNFKHLLLQNRFPDQSQILCGASLGRGTKVCPRHVGHMTKMADMPIYGKNSSKIFFSRTGRPIFTKLGM